MPSWAPTARASPRWPAPCSETPPTRSPRGAIRFRGEDVTAWPTDVRAKAGMFLAFQYPEEIPGVPVIQFLRQAVSGRVGEDRSVLEVRMSMLEWMKRLGMDPAFGERHLNEGFSGGEKKRNEILQMAHARTRAGGARRDRLRASTSTRCASWPTASRPCAASGPTLGVLLVTHYTRILELLRPDAVHVLVDGKIVESGGPGAGASASRPRATSRGGGDRDGLSRRPGAGGVASCAPVPPRHRFLQAQGRLPHARPHGARASHRLPRLGVVRPAPAVRPRRHGRLLPDHPRQRAPRASTPSPRRRTVSTKRPGWRWAGSSAPPTPSTR